MRIISLFFVGVMSLLMLQAQEPAMTVNFLEEENWAQARELAAEQDKFIFVDAYTEWCGWCKVQDKNTFTNEDVGNLINENFVSVKLDFERGDGVKLARKYRIQSYPTLLFFTSDGRYVGKKVGYDADIDNFMSDVMDKMKPENYFPEIGDPDVLDPGFPEFYVSQFGPNGERTRAKPEQISEWLDGQENIYSEVPYNILMTMQLDEKWSQFFLDNHKALAEKFIASEVQDKLTNVLVSGAYAAMRNKDEGALDAAFAKMEKYLPAEEVENIATNLRINFYMMSKDYDKLIPIMNKLAAREDGNYDNTINSIAWNLYEGSDDQMTLKTASKWMYTVMDRNPENYMFMDTHAALLYKTGSYAQAKEAAAKAIQIGKSDGEDVSGTEELLKKITSAMTER